MISSIARWLTAVLLAAVPVAPTAQAPVSCAPPAPQPVKPTTVSTIEQLYHCVFTHYYGGDTLDPRTLLAGAFAGLTQELDRRGLDQPWATLPALIGDRSADWAAFSALYRRIGADQAMAAATVNGMLATLHDNHVHWQHGSPPDPGYGFGFTASPIAPLPTGAALPPMYLTSVTGPAATAGLAVGDVIELVNEAPPFVDGVVSPGVLTLLNPSYPNDRPVALTVNRSGRVWTVTLKPARFTPLPLV